MVHYTAPAATREQIGRVHGAQYIDEIDAVSPEEGLHFIDPGHGDEPAYARALHDMRRARWCWRSIS